PPRAKPGCEASSSTPCATARSFRPSLPTRRRWCTTAANSSGPTVSAGARSRRRSSSSAGRAWSSWAWSWGTTVSLRCSSTRSTPTCRRIGPSRSSPSRTPVPSFTRTSRDRRPKSVGRDRVDLVSRNGESPSSLAANGACEHPLEVNAFGESGAGHGGIEGDAEHARRLRRRRGVVDEGGVAIDPGEQSEMTREPLEPGARPAIYETRRTPRRRAARVEQAGEQKLIEGLRGARVLLDRVVVGGRRVRLGGCRQRVGGGDERTRQLRGRAEVEGRE